MATCFTYFLVGDVLRNKLSVSICTCKFLNLQLINEILLNRLSVYVQKYCWGLFREWQRNTDCKNLLTRNMDWYKIKFW